MKVLIDISIFATSGSAFGNAHGEIELSETPQIGDTISFVFPRVEGLVRVSAFTGLLRVKDRILDANGGSRPVSLALYDLVVPTVEDARAIAEYLEKGFGLFFDKY